METVIHLRTARVYATHTDGTPKIERTTVKLTDGQNFLKFVKNMHLKGYIKKEPPFVLRVIQKEQKEKWDVKSSGKWPQEIDSAPWQKIVDEALLTKKPEGKIDYKALAEKQKNELDQLKASINDRFKALEDEKKEVKPPEQSYRKDLEAKAKALGIKFRDNIGDVKLLAKIVKVEPDFKV